LSQLSESPVLRVAFLAGLLQEIAAATPFKRKRYGVLRAKYPELLASLLDCGIALPEYAICVVEAECDWVPNMDENAEEDTDG
jgi:hypothetical protein